MAENVIENRPREELIFFPYLCREQQRISDSNSRFVHYTSAEVAMNIIKKNEIWMRKSTCMNDRSEVKYGLNLISYVWHGDIGKVFRKQIDEIFYGVSDEIAKFFDEWRPSFLLDTYLTCFSVHDKDEDNFGRLSMWRAYGGNTSVAFVLNNNAFLSRTDALRAYVKPVAYFDEKLFSSHLFEIAENIEGNKDYLKTLNRVELVNWCFDMLRYFALCTKHPVFKEEREWRLIYSPFEIASNYGGESKVIKKQIESINSIPQPICKVPLKEDIHEEGLNNLHLSKSLDRIIIGPSDYPEVLSESFVELLKKAGVENAADKVFISNIPLRR